MTESTIIDGIWADRPVAERSETQHAWQLRTGAVSVNASVFSAYAAGGGYKQSGLGRERGPEGIREFQEVKHMAIGELK